jgi:hypothetical protein
MKTSDYVSSALSLIAIAISLFVWRTTDTRASELREKVIRYSVVMTFDTIANEFSAKKKKTKDPKQIAGGEGKLIEETDTVELDISNTGTLPTKDVTITIPTQSPDGKIPPYHIELEPAREYDPIVRGSSLVIHFRNPMGAQSEVQATVKFDAARNGRQAVKGFTVKDPLVDSEVGGASLIGFLRGEQSNF